MVVVVKRELCVCPGQALGCCSTAQLHPRKVCQTWQNPPCQLLPACAVAADCPRTLDSLRLANLLLLLSRLE